MEDPIGILMNTPDHFAQIVEALGIESGSDDFDLAHEFWSAINAAITSAWPDRDPRLHAQREEAVVWRILSRRMLRALGETGVFQSRNKGAASGTCVVHPGVDMLAKTYERLRRTMDELVPPAETADTATGLPIKMMKLLEETEGALEQALGVGPGEAEPFTPRLVRRDADGVDGGL